MDIAFACLALTLYFEARDQSVEGQLAVAQVVMNRVESDAFPDDVCSVVRDGGEIRHRCQFSWYCDGRPDVPYNAKAWEQAQRAANLVLIDGLYDPRLEGVTHYHAVYVQPYWAQHMEVVAQIGDHIFYKE